MIERRSSWLRVAQPPAQAVIAAPLFFGQSLALISCGRFSWALFGWTQLVGVLVHALIVFGRSASDGPRPDAPPIRAQIVLTFAALLGLAAVGAHLAFSLDRPFMIAMLMLPPMLLWADSFPPLALRKRGLGHWLHGIGVGSVLPLLGFYLQCGELMTLMGGVFAASLSAAIGGGLALERPRAKPRQGLALALIALAALSTPFVIEPSPPSTALALAAAAPLALLAFAFRSRADVKRFSWSSSAAVVAIQLGWAACAWAASLPRA